VTASSWFGGDGSKIKDPQVLVRQGNVVGETGKGRAHVVGAKTNFMSVGKGML
jgi:hypothetical protein